jgi:hypothetical protein
VAGRFVSRHAGAILASTLVLFACAAFLSSKLELKTAISELLPSDDPGVVALEKTQSAWGTCRSCSSACARPTAQANLRYAERLTQKLLELPKDVVSLATYHVRDLKAFFEEQVALHRRAATSSPFGIACAARSPNARTRCSSISPTTTKSRSMPCATRLTKQDHLGGRFPDGVFSNKTAPTSGSPRFRPAASSASTAARGIFQAATRLLQEKSIRTPSTRR